MPMARLYALKLKKQVNPRNLHYRLNQILPKSIRVNKIKGLVKPFHPTLDALAKIYLYKVENTPIGSPFFKNQAWHIYRDLDLELMQEAKNLFIGQKDFKGFANKHCHEDTIRCIETINIKREKPLLLFEIKGKSFLYKMVRNIVGSLVYIGLRKLTKKRFTNGNGK